MILKGCTKRVIVIKDSTSPLFEEAIFFVKPQSEKSYSNGRESDFIREANRLISKKTTSGESFYETSTKQNLLVKKKSKNFGRDVFFFIFGAIVSLSISLIYII